MVGVEGSVFGELEVESVPLEVVIVLDVDVSVDDRLGDVKEEEHGNEREQQTREVTRQANVQHSVSLERDEGVVQAVGAGFGAEGNLLLSEPLDVLVDVALKLGFDFVSFNHLDHLLLLFVGGAVGGANLGQALVDVVLETFTHIYDYN